jgi:kinetochore protein Mis13/DSN1
VFTRASKRSKTATTADSAPTNAPPPTSTAKRGRKPKDTKEPKPPRDEEDVAAVKKPRGRKLSFSTPKAESNGIIVLKRRKSTRTSTGNSDDANTAEPSRTQPVEDSMSLVHGGSVPDMNGTDVNLSKNSTIITLPFSDTPVINRNKEMRKKGGNGQRRSSLGLRGRRASSLIDSGHSAIPHAEVETTEFYKHIEDGLVETRRMKQLFTWTAERCLGGNPEFGDPEKAIKHAGKICKISSSRGRGKLTRS